MSALLQENIDASVYTFGSLILFWKISVAVGGYGISKLID